MPVNGGEKMGHWGGARVYHQGLLASINVRTNCSGRMSPIQLCQPTAQANQDGFGGLPMGRLKLGNQRSAGCA